MTDPRPAIRARLAAQAEASLERIRAFIRIPSVSPERRALAEGAAFTARALAESGAAEAAVLDVGDGLPGAFGRIDDGAARTLLIYGHHDVRPEGTEAWSEDPFSGAVRAFDRYPRVVMGRGAAAKAPLLAFCHAAAAMRAVLGRLPVNLVFLIEGAEILGSPNVPRLVAARQDAFARASALYGPRVGQDAAGAVAVTLGYKGLVVFDLVARGAAWGRGPGQAAVHSATSAIVEGPAWRLAQALAALGDDPLGIPALAAAIGAPHAIAAWEEPLLAALAERMQAVGPDALIPGLASAAPVAAFRPGLAGRALLERYLYGPSINLSGLRAGYVGPGSKTFLLPHEARATIDLRVLSDTPAEALLAALRAHLDAAGFADIAIEPACAYDGHQTHPEASLPRAAISVLARHGHAARLWPMQAYGGPWAHYGKAFGIPFLFGGAPGFGGRQAGADEFFVLDGAGTVAGLAELEAWFVDLLLAFASQP